jgi:chemotaxis protein MotA
MNLSTLTGLLFAFGVFFGSVVMAFDNVTVLLDWNAVLMVLGGTFAATLICFPLTQLAKMFKVFGKRMLGLKRKNYVGLVEQIVMVSKEYRRSKKSLGALLESLSDPFLKEATALLQWSEAEITGAELKQVLETRAQTHYEEYSDDADIFRTVSKFPPAFGLMGTTLGMIALLQGLGGDNAAETIGPAMAIALITTLYGLAISNFLLIPIAENLTKQTKEDYTARMIVVEGIIMVFEGRPTLFVQEQLKSFLLPGLRQKIGVESAVDPGHISAA